MALFRLASCCAAMCAVACGSSSGDDLFGSGGSSTGGASTGGAGTTGGRTSTGGATSTGGVATNGGMTSTGGMSTSGGTASTGGVTSTGGATSSGGATTTGGVTSTGGVGATGGASAGPTPGTIACAGTDCVIAGTPTNICCIPGGLFPQQCTPSFPGCVTGPAVRLECDDAADCLPGDECCFDNALAQCKASCAVSDQQLCRSDAECLAGTCQPVLANPVYSSCQ